MFVHIGAVERAGMRDLNEGQKISYEVVAERRTGKSLADKLKPAPRRRKRKKAFRRRHRLVNRSCDFSRGDHFLHSSFPFARQSARKAAELLSVSGLL